MKNHIKSILTLFLVLGCSQHASAAEDRRYAKKPDKSSQRSTILDSSRGAAARGGFARDSLVRPASASSGYRPLTVGRGSSAGRGTPSQSLSVGQRVVRSSSVPPASEGQMQQALATSRREADERRQEEEKLAAQTQRAVAESLQLQQEAEYKAQQAALNRARVEAMERRIEEAQARELQERQNAAAQSFSGKKDSMQDKSSSSSASMSSGSFNSSSGSSSSSSSSSFSAVVVKKAPIAKKTSLLSKLEKHSTHKPASVTVGEESCAAFLNQEIILPCMADAELKITGDVRAQGKMIEIAKNTYLAQLAMVDQHTACSECGGNIGGGNESCGYHAVKNSILTALGLCNPDFIHRDMGASARMLSMNLHDFRCIGRLFIDDPKQGWRKVLCTHDQVLAERNGEWLESRHIEPLFAAESIEGGLLNSISKKVKVTVLENVQMFQLLTEGETFKKIWGGDDDCLHLFIINDAPQLQQGMGHWFAVAAYKCKQDRYYIILDSKNRLRFAHPDVCNLVSYAQGALFDPTKVPAIAKEVVALEAQLNERMMSLQTEQEREDALRLVYAYEGLGGINEYRGLIAAQVPDSAAKAKSGSKKENESSWVRWLVPAAAVAAISVIKLISRK